MGGERPVRPGCRANAPIGSRAPRRRRVRWPGRRLACVRKRLERHPRLYSARVDLLKNPARRGRHPTAAMRTPQQPERAVVLLVAAVQFVNILDFVMVMPMGPDFAAALGIPASKLGL